MQDTRLLFCKNKLYALKIYAADMSSLNKYAPVGKFVLINNSNE